MGKRKDLKVKTNLTNTQEVLYSKEFREANRAGGFTEHGRRR
ncbi:YfhE family protein [Bacillus sp. FJAT-50079]|nr:YfhE family protein [Bacillus sp. FJAT-50079]MBS4209133.1 YfhE family protein [Bacillus sp. FJAT-50079]